MIGYRRGGSIVVVNPRGEAARTAIAAEGIDGARDLLTGRMQRGSELELAAYGVAVLELAD